MRFWSAVALALLVCSAPALAQNKYISQMTPVGSVQGTDTFQDCIANACNSTTASGQASASQLSTYFATSLTSAFLSRSLNLSDLGNPATARTNLGLGGLAVLSAPLPYADLPALSANQILGALTATTPSGLSVPSCSGSTNALTWASGVGFGCNTIAGGGSGTVTNIATSAPLSGGPITTTGTLSLTGPSDLTTFTAGTVPMGAGTSPFVASEITDVASGGVTIGSPTGGQKGAGTINMTGCFINNVPCAAGSSTAFSAITGGTNASAAMVVGTGASLGVSGSGTIAATSMPASGLTGTLLAAQFPALTGDVTTVAGSLATTLATVNSNIGTFASETVNGKGLVTAAGNLSGDLTTSGAVATLATVNSNVGSFTNANITVNAKGLITAAANGSGGPGTVTSVALTAPPWLTVGGSPITTSGTLALTGTSESANLFLASPNGSSGAMTPRAIVLADLPSLSANTVLGALTGTTPSGLAVPSCVDSAGNHLNYTLGTGFSCGTTSSGATTITLAPGLAATPTSYNTGTQTVTNGSTVSPQLFYEGHATSYTVLSTDGAKLLTATAASVTFTAPNPGSVGTTTYQFGYDASHSYTITTAGGTASIYGCGSTSTSVSLTYPAQIITDGTNYQCVPNGGSGGGSGTVTSVGLTVPGSSILGVTGSPVTTSGNLGLTTTGTSGGIPYFSSTSALSSSALLAAGNLMVGGGAGTAPATNPDWSFSSNVLVGNFNSTAVPSPATLVSNGAIIAGADGTNSGFGLIGTNGAQGIIQDITYGGTLASPTALGTSVNIGGMVANGYDGTSVTTTAPVGIQFQTCSGAAWVHGTNTCAIIGFNTTASGSVTPGTNAALRSDGSFIVSASAGAVTSPGAHGLYVSGPTSITQGYSVPSALTDGATIAVNAALSNNFTVTIAGNRTLSNPTNLVAGQILNFQITQDATGNRTLAFGTNYNGAISLNPAANAITLFSCYASSSSSLQCAGGAPAGVTASNCSSGASPAVCGSARAGSVAVPTGATPTLVINSTAVTANSEILLSVDESATIAGTTCNTTLATLVNPVVTARSAGTSFTIQMNSTLAANPACVDYQIVN